MPVNNIVQKVQDALKAYLITQALGDIPVASVFTGITNDPAVRPSVHCQCSRAEAEDTTSGNWVAEVTVLVLSQANDSTEAEHLARSGTVFDILMDTTIAASLSSSLTGFVVFLSVPRATGYSIEGDSWSSYLTLSITCAGTDIV